MTKREEILQAVFEKLKANGVVPSAKVFRSRIDPFQAKNLPCVTLEPVSDVPLAENLSYTDWTLTVRVCVYVVGPTPDESADSTVEAIHQKLMDDRSLGGLLMNTSPIGVSFDFVDSAPPMVCVQNDFELFYRTLN